MDKDIKELATKRNSDGTEKHIVCDGARFHVVTWDSKGAKCSEPTCEINKRRIIKE